MRRMGKGQGRGREPRRRPLQGGTGGWGGRGMAVQVLRSEEMPLRHLAVGLPNLDFRGLVWRCNFGGFGLAPAMTTQGCRPSSAQDWGLGSPLSTSSVGCVLGSLPQPPHLPQPGLPTEAPASVSEAITQASRPHCSRHGSFHCRPQLFTENRNKLGKPQTQLSINPALGEGQADSPDFLTRTGFC